MNVAMAQNEPFSFLADLVTNSFQHKWFLRQIPRAEKRDNYILGRADGKVGSHSSHKNIRRDWVTIVHIYISCNPPSLSLIFPTSQRLYVLMASLDLSQHIELQVLAIAIAKVKSRVSNPGFPGCPHRTILTTCRIYVARVISRDNFFCTNNV